MIDFKKEEDEFKKILAHFEEELKNVRTGRAHISLVENLMVDSYGVPTQLSHIASLSTPDARSIIIQPWDKSLLPKIEEALQKSSLGLAPFSDKEQVRLALPALTEERRKELVKIVSKKMEECRISVRKKRDEIWKAIQEEERAKLISENLKFSQKEKMEKIVEEVNKKIEETAKKKEKEIMEV